MRLYTIYNQDNKQVFSTFAEGKTQFFYRGFTSAEEAKNATFEFHFNYELSKSKPNAQGISRPSSMIKAWVETSLQGEWSEIE